MIIEQHIREEWFAMTYHRMNKITLMQCKSIICCPLANHWLEVMVTASPLDLCDWAGVKAALHLLSATSRSRRGHIPYLGSPPIGAEDSARPACEHDTLTRLSES